VADLLMRVGDIKTKLRLGLITLRSVTLGKIILILQTHWLLKNMKHPRNRGERKEINRIKSVERSDKARRPIASETIHEEQIRSGNGSDEVGQPVA